MNQYQKKFNFKEFAKIAKPGNHIFIQSYKTLIVGVLSKVETRYHNRDVIWFIIDDAVKFYSNRFSYKEKEEFEANIWRYDCHFGFISPADYEKIMYMYQRQAKITKIAKNLFETAKKQAFER